MKKKTLLAIMVALFIAGAYDSVLAAGGAVPGKIAGIILGEPVERFKELLDMETVLPVRYFESLKEVEIRPVPGFKSGLVQFSTCIKPERILRIKLKYSYADKDFYEGLLRRFKKIYGEPDEYRGDPFHVLVAWKWSFVDEKGLRISMILQHNTRKSDEKFGCSLKLTATDLLAEEFRCFRGSMKERRADFKKMPEKGGMMNWSRFVPTPR